MFIRLLDKRKPILWIGLAISIAVCISGLIGYKPDVSFLKPSADLCQQESFVLKDPKATILWQQQVDYGIAYPARTAQEVAIVIDRSIKATDIFSHPQSQVLEGDKIRAFDLLTGKPLWVIADPKKIAQKEMTWQQAISPEYYAFTSNSDSAVDDHITVVDLKSGKTVLELPATVLELSMSNQFLFMRDFLRNLHGYDLISGQRLWTIAHSGERGNRGLYYDGEFIYEMWGVGVEKRQAETGKLITSIPLEFPGESDEIAESVFVKDNLIFAVKQGTNQDYLLLFDLSQSRAIAVFDSIRYSPLLWPPAVDHGVVYLFDQESRLHQLSINNADLTNWLQFTLDGEGKAISPPIIYGKRVYFLTSDGTLSSFDPLSQQFAVLLESSALRYSGNIPGGFINHYSPGIASSQVGLLVSFGCRTLLALRP